MEYKVKEWSTGPIDNGLDVTFHLVVMMGTDTGKAVTLMLIGRISNPFFGGEGMIVKRVVLWFDTVVF